MHSRIPGSLALRIDRAARAAHLFHRFAHHPLCGPYESEVIRWGTRTRLCRGCTFLALGAALGLELGILGWKLHAQLHPAWLLGAVGLFAVSRQVRLPKWLGRGGVGLFLGLGAASPWGFALGLCALLGISRAYRRKGPNRGPCERCPERTQSVCSGMAPTVRRERAFRRLTGQWLADL